MKLIEIWKRLGKQPLRVTQHKDAIVLINDDEYEITNIKYDSGKFIGFEAKPKFEWFSAEIKPKEDTWVIVKDKYIPDSYIYVSELLKVEDDLIFAESVKDAMEQFEDMIIDYIEDKISYYEKMLEKFQEESYE